MVFSDGSVLGELEATGVPDRHPIDSAGQEPAEETKIMIGGDSSYDSSGYGGGGPADGAPQSPPPPQSRESAAPDGPPAAPTADSENAGANEPAGGAGTGAPPATPAPAAPAAPPASTVSPAPWASSAPTALPPMPEPTGDERVDVALARFEELTAAPVAEHVEVFEDVQRRLQDVLASIDHEQPPEAR